MLWKNAPPPNQYTIKHNFTENPETNGTIMDENRVNPYNSHEHERTQQYSYQQGYQYQGTTTDVSGSEYSNYRTTNQVNPSTTELSGNNNMTVTYCLRFLLLTLALAFIFGGITLSMLSDWEGNAYYIGIILAVIGVFVVPAGRCIINSIYRQYFMKHRVS